MIGAINVSLLKIITQTPKCLRIDKGYLRGALHLARRFKTMIDVIIYYRYSERVYFSLFNDIYLVLIYWYQDLREL